MGTQVFPEPLSDSAPPFCNLPPLASSLVTRHVSLIPFIPAAGNGVDHSFPHPLPLTIVSWVTFQPSVAIHEN